VIAAVVAGLVLGWRSSRILTPETRLVATGAWEILTFVLNGFAFLLVGLELRAIVSGPPLRPVPELLAAAVVVSAAVVGARFAWVYASLLAPGIWARIVHHEADRVPVALPLVVSWSGMRGAISLAAALALPADFPERALIVLLTFVVIGATLVGQGLTLPLIARRAELPPGTIDLEEEALARNRAAESALSRLRELRGEWPDHLPLIDNLEAQYRHRLEHLPDADAEGEVLLDPAREHELEEHHAIASAVIAAERETLIDLRDRAEISDAVLRRLERELDLEEARVEAEL
jgi:CPA1 family monovalent cation:H+ antiporter